MLEWDVFKFYVVNLFVYIGNGGSLLCIGVLYFIMLGVVLLVVVLIVFLLLWKVYLYDFMKFGRLDIYNDI